MWVEMTPDMVVSWLNGYWSPAHVRESEHGVEWWDEAATIYM